MTDDRITYDEAVGIWGYLGASCSGPVLDAATIEIRARDLVDEGVTFQSALTAAKAWVRQGQWIPSTGQLLQAITPSRTPEDVVGEMFHLMATLGAVRYGTAICAEDHASDEVLALVGYLGGWDAANGNQGVVRAHALKMAPAAIEAARRVVPGRPAIEGPGGRRIELPDFRINRDNQ